MVLTQIDAKTGCKAMYNIEKIMKFRDLYLEDLQANVFYGGNQPRKKVHNVKVWQDLTPLFRTQLAANPIDKLIDHTHVYDTWIWADQHFFHTNIIKYCNRPYPNIELMNQCLIGNYNNVVKPDDVCIFVGDVGFGNDKQICNIINQLNGYKILVIGNHDMKFYNHLKNVFHEINLLYLIEDNNAEIIFTHYPMDNLPLHITNVHGHLHEKITGNEQHINVAVERIGYTPINLKEILPIAHKRVEMYE